MPKKSPQMVSLEVIHREVSKSCGVPLDYAFQDTSISDVLDVRQMIYYVANKLNPKMTLEEIGEYGLKRYKSSVYQSVKKVERKAEENEDLREQLDAIMVMCEPHRAPYTKVKKRKKHEKVEYYHEERVDNEDYYPLLLAYAKSLGHKSVAEAFIKEGRETFKQAFKNQQKLKL
jgi:hypothetical protein